MSTLKSIAVFCGSSKGNNSIYAEMVTELGCLIASKNYTLVYGGSGLGLMHYIADAVLKKGGKTIGVIPDFFSNEIINMKEVSELILVSSMAERKQKIAEISDAFIALPGGYGTFDELFEMLALLQLGLHNKPIGLLNINNFYDPLIKQLDIMLEEGFMSHFHRSMLFSANDSNTLLELLENYTPCTEQKNWVEKIRKQDS